MDLCTGRFFTALYVQAPKSSPSTHTTRPDSRIWCPVMPRKSPVFKSGSWMLTSPPGRCEASCTGAAASGCIAAHTTDVIGPISAKATTAVTTARCHPSREFHMCRIAFVITCALSSSRLQLTAGILHSSRFGAAAKFGRQRHAAGQEDPHAVLDGQVRVVHSRSRKRHDIAQIQVIRGHVHRHERLGARAPFQV